MAISKVVYGNDTLIDITDSTVDASNMLNGTVGYSSAGDRTVGTYVDSDEKVKQENTTTNADYRVLFSNGANDTTETKTARKSTKLKFNPNSGNLVTTKLNGNTVPTGTGTIALTSDIPTIPGVVSTTADGLAPMITDTGKYLKGDGTWSDANDARQYPTPSTNADYRVLFSSHADDTDRNSYTRKDTDFKYNPSTNNLMVGKINGNTAPTGTGTIALTSDIPTVNNKTIKVQVNSTDFTNNTFTLNQSSDKTIDIPVTKSDVGLGNVPNVTTNNQTPTFSVASSRANIASGEKLSVIFGKIMKWFTDLKDLAFIAKDGNTTTYLRGDGTWQAFPTVNNAILTIQKNGTTVKTFTANASSNVTCNITVPTKTSDVTNDSGFITSSDIPGVVSTSANGLAPKVTDTSKYLKGDGTWATPTDTNTVACAYCDTAAGTAAKTATCTDYALLNKSWLIVTIKTSNTSKNALTLNVNGKGAKSIYINDIASSSSNYTLNAGTYLVYYESNIYYFRNDGRLSLKGGGTVNNSFYYKNTTVDMTKTGNNLSSSLWTDYHFVDNNNKIGASVRPVYYTSSTTGEGNVSLDLIVRNHSVPGEGETSVQMASGGFTLTAEKNGNLGAKLDNTHTATGVKNIIFSIGNNKANGTASSNDGVLRLYGKGAYYGQFYDANNILTGNRTYTLPNANGMMALTSDITKAINNALTWTDAGVVLPNSQVIISATGVREILIKGEISSSEYGPFFVNILILPEMLTSDYCNFRGGWHQTSTSGGAIYFGVKKASGNINISLYYGYLNNQDVTSRCAGTVYYR